MKFTIVFNSIMVTFISNQTHTFSSAFKIYANYSVYSFTNTVPLQKSSTILENNAFCLDVIEFIYKIPRQRIVRHGLGESTSQRIPLCVPPACWDPLNIIVSKPMLKIEVQCLFVCIRKIMLFWNKTRKKTFNLLHIKCAI